MRGWPCGGCGELFGEFRRPHTLPCGHNLCTQCIQTCSTSACDICKQSFSSDETSINDLAEQILKEFGQWDTQDLKIDEKADEIAAIEIPYDEKTQYDQQASCSRCEEHLAEQYCIQCNRILCVNCTEELHLGFRKNHVRFRNCHMLAICARHDLEYCMNFCLDCEESLCNVCIEENIHQTCEIAHIQYDRQRYESRIDRLLRDSLDAMMSHYDDFSIRSNSFCLELNRLSYTIDHCLNNLRYFGRDHIRYIDQIIQEYMHLIQSVSKQDDPIKFFLWTKKLTQEIIHREELLMEMSVPWILLVENFREVSYSSNLLLNSLESYPVIHPRFLPESNILGLPDRIKLLDWYGNHQARWFLAFRASRDGFDTQSFHDNCDDRGESFVIIKAEGFVFGGYAAESWTSKNTYISGSGNSWIFILHSPYKTPMKLLCRKNQDELACQATIGPTFGRGYDLHLCNNSNKTKKSYFNIGRSYDNDHIQESDEALFQSKHFFIVDDYEVFLRLRTKPQ